MGEIDTFSYLANLARMREVQNTRNPRLQLRVGKSNTMPRLSDAPNGYAPNLPIKINRNSITVKALISAACKIAN